MNLSYGDAIGSAIDSVRGFRWTEYVPFFWILALQLIFLALTCMLDKPWAMGIVAPIAAAVGGTANLHYPTFYGYLSILLGWVESFVYTVPGAIFIPLSLLRFYARSDRALSLGAGAATRLVAAVIPTLLAGAALVGANWEWQRYAAPPLAATLRGTAPAPLGDIFAWLGVTIGSYAIWTLLLYVPIAAVQARTNPVRAIAMGIRFGLRAWPMTMSITVFFGVPAMIVQYVLEKHGAFIISRLRPEIVIVFLVAYAVATSIATYLTYLTGARLYRIARGET